MKQKLLSVLVIAAGMSLVACDDGGGGQVAGQPSCLTNPTLPGCSLQKAALAQVPGSPEQAAALQGKPYTNPPALTQVPGGVPNIPGVTTGPDGLPLARVSDKQISAQAAKVLAAIDADKQNPDSPFYVAPKVQADEAPQRSPSSIEASAAPEVPLAPKELEGGGSASH